MNPLVIWLGDVLFVGDLLKPTTMIDRSISVDKTVNLKQQAPSKVSSALADLGQTICDIVFTR